MIDCLGAHMTRYAIRTTRHARRGRIDGSGEGRCAKQSQFPAGGRSFKWEVSSVKGVGRASSFPASHFKLHTFREDYVKQSQFHGASAPNKANFPRSRPENEDRAKKQSQCGCANLKLEGSSVKGHRAGVQFPSFTLRTSHFPRGLCETKPIPGQDGKSGPGIRAGTGACPCRRAGWRFVLHSWLALRPCWLYHVGDNRAAWRTGYHKQIQTKVRSS